MSIMQGLRAYYAVLGPLVIVAFLTGELRSIHAVFVYAIAVIIGGRLVAALSGLQQLGLSRFYPQFNGLTLGIAACLILDVATGITIDRGRTLGTAINIALTAAQAPDDSRERHRDAEARRGEQEDDIIGELHKVLSNFLMIIVGLHVAYCFCSSARWRVSCCSSRPQIPVSLNRIVRPEA